MPTLLSHSDIKIKRLCATAHGENANSKELQNQGYIMLLTMTCGTLESPARMRGAAITAQNLYIT